MSIDVHAHYFPREYFDYLKAHGSEQRGVDTAPGARISMEERLGMMDEAGIAQQVLAVGANQCYLKDATVAADGARLLNDLYADLCRAHPGRFLAAGALPLPHTDAALREAGRCLDELGMVGISLGCSVAGHQLDDPALDPFWAEMDRRAAVVILHPMGTGAGPMTDAYGLRWTVAGCFEDTSAALRLALSGLLVRYPRVRVIVPHLGGTLPFFMQRLDDSEDRHRSSGEDAAPISENPSQVVRRLYFDTVNGYGPALRLTCEAFGADRVMLGTDFPYLVGPKFKQCVTYIEESGLAQTDVQAILRTTAENLFGLARP